MCIHEDRIKALKGEPITRQISANKIWKDHLRSSCGNPYNKQRKKENPDFVCKG